MKREDRSIRLTAKLCLEYRVSAVQVGSPAEVGTMLSGVPGADVSMQAHDRDWSTLEGHTQAITSLAYTVDGMYMLSGTRLTHLSHAFMALFLHDRPVLRICALKLNWWTAF